MKIMMKRSFWVLLIFCMGCGSSTTDSNQSDSTLSTKKRSLIEKFSFEDLDGNKINWNDTKGKIVFVNFWATWCKPCLKEMPSVSKAYAQLKDKNVMFIIASDEDPEKIKKYESKHPYSFKLLHSKTSVFDLEVKALPTTLIINENGKVVFNEIGARDWSSDKNIALIKSFSVAPN